MNNTKKEKRRQKDNKKINDDLAEAQMISRFIKVRRRFLNFNFTKCVELKNTYFEDFEEDLSFLNYIFILYDGNDMAFSYLSIFYFFIR